MRLDLFLKWSRVVSRRPMARATCDAGNVTVNGEVARASRAVKVDDVIGLKLPARRLSLRVLSIPERSPSKVDAAGMIEILENQRRKEDSIS